MSRDTDLRILDTILDAIATGRFPALSKAADEFRVLRGRIRDGVDGPDCLAETLRRLPGGMEGVIVATAEKTLAFIQEQIDHFTAIEKERPLTRDEKQFGSATLIGLLGSLRRLLSSRCGRDPRARDRCI